MALKTKLAELIVDINAKLSPLKGQLAKANGMMKRGLASMVRMARRAGKWIAVGLVAALAWATRAAMVQESAELDLAAALRQTGDATKDNIKSFKKFASEIQKVTTHGDEFVLSIMAQLKNLGVHTDRLKEATKMVIGLSAATGRDTSTMITATAAVEAGSTELLQRYIPALRTTKDGTKKMNLVLALAADGFEIAKERAETTAGVLKQLWNVIGDIAETIISPFLPRLKRVANAIKEWALANKELIAAKFGLWLDATGKAVVILAKGVEQLLKHWKILVIWVGLAAFGKLSGGVFKVATGIRLMANAAKAFAAMSYANTIAAFIKMGRTTRELTSATIAATRATKVYAAASTAAAGAVAVAWAAVVAAIAVATYLIGGAAIKAGKEIRKAFAAEKRLGKWQSMSMKERLAALRKERDARWEKMKVDGTIAAWAKKAEDKRKKADREKKEKDRAAAVIAKDTLEAQLAFLEKIGGKYRDIAKLKRDLLEIEAKETAAATGGDPLEIRRGLTRKAIALQRSADRAAHEERRAEYREKLETLKNLFEGEKRFAKDLAVIKKKLRHEEALDVQKAAPWLDVKTIAAMLAAKETPVEIAKAGLTGIASAWGQIATGAQRTQEEQLRALEGIRESVERQQEIAEAGRGLSGTATPRY